MVKKVLKVEELEESGEIIVTQWINTLCKKEGAHTNCKKNEA